MEFRFVSMLVTGHATDGIRRATDALLHLGDIFGAKHVRSSGARLNGHESRHMLVEVEAMLGGALVIAAQSYNMPGIHITASLA